MMKTENTNDMKLGGYFTIEHVRDGEVIHSEVQHNIVTNEGLNHILNTVFNGGTQVTTWYVGLFKNNYTPVATDVADTFHEAGYAGEATEYDETVRQTYVEATSTAQSITNSASKATFTINGSITVYGAFLSNVSAKSTGAASDTLMAATLFTASRAVISGDQLLITYTFNAADA